MQPLPGQSDAIWSTTYVLASVVRPASNMLHQFIVKS